MVFKFLAYNKEIRQEIATHVLEETTVPLNVSLYLMLESLQNRFFESSYLASTLLHTFEDIGKLVFDKGAVPSDDLNATMAGISYQEYREYTNRLGHRLQGRRGFQNGNMHIHTLLRRMQKYM